MNKHLRFLIAGSLTCLIILGFIESDFFKSNKTFSYSKYNEGRQLMASDFRGDIPRKTVWDAGISSSLRYSYNAAEKHLEVFSAMYHDYSWISEQYKDDVSLLTHELYHFRIKEYYARLLRRELSELNYDEFVFDEFKRRIQKLGKKYDDIDNFYDNETRHGADYRKQRNMEFFLDSLLTDLDSYSGSRVWFKDQQPKTNCFRSFYFNDNYQVLGYLPVAYHDTLKSDYYQFFQYSDSTLIFHYNNGKLKTDEDFGAAILKIEKHGNSELWRAYNEKCKPIAFNEGFFMVNIKRRNKEIIRLNLDKKGGLKADSDGVAKKVWKTNKNGQRIFSSYFDKNNKPTTLSDDCFHLKYHWNERNQLNRIDFLNHQKEKTVNEKDVYSEEYTRNEKGNVEKVQYLNKDLSLINNKEGIAIVELKYDRYGNCISEKYIDKNETIVPGVNNCAYSSIGYDRNKRIIRKRYFGLNRNLLFDDEGYCDIRFKYDSLDRVVQISNFDIYNEPYNNNEGAAVFEYIHDKYSPFLAIRKYEVLEENPLEVKFRNAFKLLQDKHGNTLEYRYTDSCFNDHPTKQKILSIKYRYNDKGVQIETRHLDSLGNAVRNENNTALIRYTQDKQTYVEYNYDEQENLCLNSNNSAIYKGHKDLKGNIIKSEFLDTKGKPINSWGNVAVIKRKFNQFNKLVKITFFDQNLKETTNPTGQKCIQYAYDKTGKERERTYTSNLKPEEDTLHANYSIRYFYDQNNDLIAEQYYSPLGGMLERKNNSAAKIFYRNLNGDIVFSEDFSINRNIDFNRIVDSLIHTSNNFIGIHNHADVLIDDLFFVVNYKYYTNGRTKSESQYLDGKLHGITKIWYESGNLKQSIYYKHGNKHGESLVYYENGSIKELLSYNSNKLITPRYSWYSNGQMQTKLDESGYTEWDEEGNVLKSD